MLKTWCKSVYEGLMQTSKNSEDTTSFLYLNFEFEDPHFNSFYWMIKPEDFSCMGQFYYLMTPLRLYLDCRDITSSLLKRVGSDIKNMIIPYSHYIFDSWYFDLVVSIHINILYIDSMTMTVIKPVCDTVGGPSKSGQHVSQMCVCVCLPIPPPKPQTACRVVTDIWLPLILMVAPMFNTAWEMRVDCVYVSWQASVPMRLCVPVCTVIHNVFASSLSVLHETWSF